MPCISIKPGDSLTVGEDVTIQFDKLAGGRFYLSIDDVYGDVSVVRGTVSEPTKEEMQDQLWKLAREIVSGLSALESAQSRELLGSFVSELFLSAAKQEHHEKRCQRQAEAMAAAKARGVRFGARPHALPDNFDEMRQAWRDGEMSLKAAAEACGIPKSTFHEAVRRAERAARSGEEQKPPAKPRQKRAKESASAESKGARPGPKPRELPEDFEMLRQAWRNKKLTLRAAAEICGMPQSTFYSAAVRAEDAARAEKAG